MIFGCSIILSTVISAAVLTAFLLVTRVNAETTFAPGASAPLSHRMELNVSTVVERSRNASQLVSGSNAFSYLALESVRMPTAAAVFLTDAASKVARRFYPADIINFDCAV